MAPDGQLRSKNRTALLGMYAALDTKLKDALGQLGVEFDGPLDSLGQLQKAAADLARQDSEDLPIPRFSVARALTDLLHERAAVGEKISFEQVKEVVEQLVDTDSVTDARAVFESFEKASSAPRFEDRWAQINQTGQNSLNHKDLRIIGPPSISTGRQPFIGTGRQEVAGELVARIETNFIVNLEGEEEADLQKIAPALLPHNWARCGDFFCGLIRRPDRDPLGSTAEPLSDAIPHWSGVYQERVGGCPNGWFPDTFLLFTWDRLADQVILRYKLLTPPRRNDRTVLKIDEGYIQVNRLHHGFQVSTLKYLLFDDKFISGGGETLAVYAPQLGWLDYAINQFTTCAEQLGGSGGFVKPGASDLGGIDAGFQQILVRLETHLRESATSADAQCDRVMRKIKEGEYGLNDFIGDWGEATLRAMKDASRGVFHEIDFARESLRLAKLFTDKAGNRS